MLTDTIEIKIECQIYITYTMDVAIDRLVISQIGNWSLLSEANPSNKMAMQLLNLYYY